MRYKNMKIKDRDVSNSKKKDETELQTSKGKLK